MKQLNEELRVTREVKTAAVDAIEDYMSFQSFGSSSSGGYDDQPAEWVDSITATTHAAKRIENLIETQIKEEQEKAAKKKKKK